MTLVHYYLTATTLYGTMMGTYSIGATCFQTRFAASNNIFGCSLVDIRWDKSYTIIKKHISDAIELIIFDPHRHKFDYLQQMHDDELLIYWVPLHNYRCLFMHFARSQYGPLDNYKIYAEVDFGPDIIMKPGQSSRYKIESDLSEIYSNSSKPYYLQYSKKTDPIFFIYDELYPAKLRRGCLIREVFYRMLIRNLDMTLLVILPQDLVNLLVEYLAGVILPDEIHSKLL